jgi:hypothetical protein
MTPNDLGVFQTVECHQKINVNDLVRQASKEVKLRLLEGKVEVLGLDLDFTTTKTRLGGERLWFVCPQCGRRVGVIYKQASQEKIGCFRCLNLKYRKQRFKGMLEAED